MKKLIATITVAALAALAIAASQVDSRSFKRMDGYYEVCATLTSNASGAASLSISNLDGMLYRFSTSPSSGATSPTANWDLTLIDDNSSFSIDVLQGAGADRSQSAHEGYIFAYPSMLLGNYTLTGANMGNTKTVFVQLMIGK